MTWWRLALAAAGAVSLPTFAGPTSPPTPPTPTTPIEHLIVIIGENQTFDAVFATYQPSPGQRVRNLRSQGIVLADGSPGPNFARAVQRQAQGGPHYSIDPERTSAYDSLPRPTLIGVSDTQFRDLGNGVDERIPPGLPSGPFPLSRFIPYPRQDSPPGFASSTAQLSGAAGDPVHRFFQMWQQCGIENRTPDLFAWVAVTAGMGGDTSGVTSTSTGQGGELMGFLNMAAGDAPYLRALADRYALSDNYHQPMMGGTAMNFFMLVTGDAPFYNEAGHAAVPPENLIENPDAVAGTGNFYRHDGYQGGSYVNCSDRDSPGVAAIVDVLDARRIGSRCEAGHYYLVNNLTPGYDLDGHPQPLGPHNYTYPPQNLPTITEALAKRGVSWRWYIGGRDAADLRAEMRTLHLSLEAARRVQYNADADPLIASEGVMTRPELRSRILGLSAFYRDLDHGALPAVSFVIPKARESGHPGNSEVASYENLVHDIVQRAQRRQRLWSHAAIIATTDEGGGYFDSGYIQMLDFFGDGPRVPLLVISPFARHGHVDHTYNDHASILKFIERNWRLDPLSPRSRDNLPNPLPDAEDAYRPRNSPAIGDLMTLFEF